MDKKKTTEQVYEQAMLDIDHGFSMLDIYQRHPEDRSELDTFFATLELIDSGKNQIDVPERILQQALDNSRSFKYVSRQYWQIAVRELMVWPQVRSAFPMAIVAMLMLTFLTYPTMSNNPEPVTGSSAGTNNGVASVSSLLKTFTDELNRESTVYAEEDNLSGNLGSHEEAIVDTLGR